MVPIAIKSLTGETRTEIPFPSLEGQRQSKSFPPLRIHPSLDDAGEDCGLPNQAQVSFSQY